LILILGIISIVTAVVGICIFPIVFGPVCIGLGLTAWILGQGDRRKMRDRVMDPSGMGLTTAGWICGMIGTGLGGLLLVCGIVGLLFLLGGGPAGMFRRF
jgi:hypothetical protein